MEQLSSSSADEPIDEASFDDNERLVAIILDEETIARRSSDIEHERAIAIYDLVEDNRFQPIYDRSNEIFSGPYQLTLSLQEGRLIFDIARQDGVQLVTHIFSLARFQKIAKDYYLVCNSYYSAIKSATPRQIEAIDMGRRGLHDEGAELLIQRLSNKVRIDFVTARRLFTLIYALQMRG